MGKGSSAKRKVETARTKNGREIAREDKAPSEPALAPTDFAPPLQPRPRLLIILSIALALWVAFLLALYFRTVYPHRNDPVQSQPTYSGEDDPGPK
jgi:hypothetical protein